MKKIMLLVVALCTTVMTFGAKSFVKANSIAAGDTVILVSEDAAMQLTSISTTSTKYGIGTAYTTTPADSYRLAVEAGNTTGSFAFKVVDESKYLYWGSGNSLNINANLTDNTSWTVAFDTNKNATIINVTKDSGSDRRILWNVSSPRFASYKNQAPGTSYYNVQLYKLEEVAAGTPDKPTFSVAGGIVETTQTVEIACATAGVTIYYTLDGSTPTTSSTVYSSALTITTTTTVKAIAVKNALSSEVASVTYTFPIEVANIAAWYAANSATSSTVYKITGAVGVTYNKGSYTYVKDATGSLLIYGNIGTLTNGQTLTGIIGTCSLYSGLLEFIPEVSKMPTPAAGTAIAPEVITVAQTASDMSKYVKMQNVQFTADVAYSTSSTVNGTVSFAGDNVTMRDNFRLGGSYSASVDYDIVCVVSVYNTNIQYYPISITDAVGTDPTIIADDEVIFNDVEVNATVAGRSVAVEGANLSAAITYNALTHFNVTGTLTTTGGSLTITPTAATLAAAGDYSETLTLTSGSVTKDITVSIHVYPTIVYPTAGTYVIAAYYDKGDGQGLKWYALTPTITSAKKAESQVIDVVNDSVLSTDAIGLEWTVAGNKTDGYTISDGTSYLEHENAGASGTNIVLNATSNHVWNLEGMFGYGGYKAYAGTSTRCLMFRGSTYNIFGGYVEGNATSDGTSEYQVIHFLPIKENTAPTLIVDRETLDFGSVERGNSGSTLELSVTGMNLTVAPTWNTLTNFDVTGTLTTTGGSLYITPKDAALAAVGTYNETLTLTSGTATKDVALTLTVIKPIVYPTAGSYVIAAKYKDGATMKYYAIPAEPTLSSNKIAGVEVTVTDDEYVTTANAAGLVWTLAGNNTSGYTFNDGTSYLEHASAGESGTNLALNTTSNHKWTLDPLVDENGGFKVLTTTHPETSRGLCFRTTASGNPALLFGGYQLNVSNDGEAQYQALYFFPVQAATVPSITANDAVNFGTVEVNATVLASNLVVTGENLTTAITYNALTHFDVGGTLTTTGGTLVIAPKAATLATAGDYTETLTLTSGSAVKNVLVNIVVEEGDNSKLNEVLANRPAIYAANGKLHVRTTTGSKIAVYNILGQQITTATAQSGETVIENLRPGQIIIVKTVDRVVKINL